MKKGMSMEWALIVVILVSLVMVFAAVLYNVIFDIGQTEFTKRQCQLSLQLTQAVDQVTPGLFCVQPVQNPIPLTCSRRFLTVTDDDVLKDGESIRYEYNPRCEGNALQLEENRVDWGGQCLPENVIADEMADCWNTFFEGEYPVFQQVEKKVLGRFADDERACFVCAEITVESEEDIENFTTYMKDKIYRGETSYYDYIARNRKAFCNPEVREQTGELGNTCWDVLAHGDDVGWWSSLLSESKDMPRIEQDRFMAGKKYAVTFMRLGMRPQEECGDDPEDIPTMTVQVLPADDIGRYCNQVLA